MLKIGISRSLTKDKMSNKNPDRPEEMNEIMFEVFGTKKKREKALSPHKQIEKEMSEMVRGIKGL